MKHNARFSAHRQRLFSKLCDLLRSACSFYFPTYREEQDISRLNFADLFTPTWEKSVIRANMKSGFRATGIFPFNPLSLPEEAFAPSTNTQLPPSKTIAIQDVPSIHNQQKMALLQNVTLQVTRRISDDSSIDCKRVCRLIQRALKICIHLSIRMIHVIKMLGSRGKFVQICFFHRIAAYTQKGKENYSCY